LRNKGFFYFTQNGNTKAFKWAFSPQKVRTSLPTRLIDKKPHLRGLMQRSNYFLLLIKELKCITDIRSCG